MMDSRAVAYEFGRFRVEPRRRRVLRSGEVVPVTPKVFDTLLLLIERRGEVVTKDEMLVALWPDTSVEENNLGQAISKLRQVLGETAGDNAFIATIPGRGYRFVADTRVVEDSAEEASAPTGATAVDPRPAKPSRRVLIGVGLLAVVVVVAYLATQRSNVAPLTSIAVLPFKPLVPQDRDEALEFGIADILIGRLATLGDINVRALGSVRRYADPSTNPADAGRELGVDAVLDGHIHRADQRIRITARLLRVADERQLWSGQFDEEFGSVFDIQNSIAQRVAEQLAARLDAEATRLMTRRDTSDPAAFESYLRGRFFMSLAQPHNAIRMFEDAVARDPQFAAAHAGLADISSRLAMATDGPAAGAMAQARQAAQRAVAIDPDLAAAHAALGWIAFYGDWNWPDSERHFQRAIQIDPRDFSAHIGLAHLFNNTARYQDALRLIEQAQALEPTSPLAGALRAQFLFYAHRYDEARDQVSRTLAVAPGFWIARVMLGRLHLQDGRVSEAIGEFESARRSGGTHSPAALIAYAHGLAGRRAEAASVLRGWGPDAAGMRVPPYLVALVQHAAGRNEEAFTWLERGYEERDVHMVFIGVDPVWDRLRAQPRFASLLTKMNFP